MWTYNDSTKRKKHGPKTGLIAALFATGLAILGLGTGFGVDRAVAAELLADCTAENDTVPRAVSCDIRTTTPYSPAKLTMSANGTVLTDSTFVPFRTSGQTTAWLYLIDRSNPARAATVKRNIALATQMVDRASSTMKIGVATFASDMQVVLPIASAHEGAAAKLSAVKADGVATEFFANALAAIKLLADVQADRKALVLISDGKAEDTAYALSDVVQAARAANVTIMGLGFAERATETPALQSIRRLSEETDGLFRAVVAGEQLPSGFLDDLSRYIDNGGTVSAPLPDRQGDVEINVTATLQDNSVLSASKTVTIAAPSVVEEKPAEPVSLIGRIYSAFKFVAPGAPHWAEQNTVLAWALLALPFVLLAGVAGFMMTRRSQDLILDEGTDGKTQSFQGIDIDVDMEADGATRIYSAGTGGGFGYFEVVGNEATRYSITSQSVSIGRHSDNDIHLVNESVHRHHAHLTVSPTGDIVIRDLDTKNGVIVNGSRISSRKLAHGDVVELGEVRIRYQAN